MLFEELQGKGYNANAVEAVRGEHDHAPCPTKNKADKVVPGMRKRAREEVETVPSINMDALQSVAQDNVREAVAAQLPTSASVKSSLYISRQAKFPPLPQTGRYIPRVSNTFTFACACVSTCARVCLCVHVCVCVHARVL